MDDKLKCEEYPLWHLPLFLLKYILLYPLTIVFGVSAMLSAIAFAVSGLVVANAVISQFLEAPLGVKNRPLDGLPALADIVVWPALIMLIVFGVGCLLCAISITHLDDKFPFLSTKDYDKREVVTKV